MLDGVAAKMEKEIGQRATLIATGGMANAVIGCCEREIIHSENLILDGLRIIYEKNQP
jgi:type III pantothenate kinase